MKRFLKALFADTHPLRLLYHRSRSVIAALRAGLPARKLTVIGITGTDGKTTTVAMVAHILKSAGIPYGAVSTAFFDVNGKRRANPTQKTSVSAARLQSFLRDLVRGGMTHAVVEASSHGLLQGRLACLYPSVAGITNVTMEHLDYHGSMDEYIAAKGLLFRALRRRGAKVLNRDDVSFVPLSAISSKQTFNYSPKSQITGINCDEHSSDAVLTIDNKSIPIRLPVPGTYNLENALCAIHCAMAVGIDPILATASLATFSGAGGRMESIVCGQPFHVFIDFTVTPAAYERTLASARRITGKNRLLVLTGSCGDRMPEKRPVVGRLCATLADVTIVTNEDPYTEDPEKIIDDVLAGVPAEIPLFRSENEYRKTKPANLNKFCVRVSDRFEAIKLILSLARKDDVVLLSGKGADVTMMTKTGQIPWVEKDITKDILRSMGFNG
jgi:UDP-N-acetylmuramoyl-L-alanyl-D-glutamate--2,6-diaminopimelate ligase